MIKLIASVFISTPILIFGFYKSYIETYRQKDLKELYKALTLLKHEISYSSRTLEEAFFSISTKVNYPISDMFLLISEMLSKEHDLNINEIFEKAILQNKDKTYISDQDIRELIDLSNTIGHLNAEAINENLDIYILYIKREIEDISQTSKDSKKLYQTLSILSSILILVILL